jgi:hypothetical protein
MLGQVNEQDDQRVKHRMMYNWQMELEFAGDMQFK